jgi:uncharacterized membrane protein YfcA
MASLPFIVYAALGIAGFAAGLVDSIAGGGGIISLPVLLSAGIPPHLALGTNKLQGSFGTLTSSLNYSRKGLVAVKETVQGIIFTALGALAGTVTIQHMPADFLKQVIPALLIGVFFYTLLSPKMGEKDGAARMPRGLFYIAAGLFLGFYDGFFGPGAGAFWMIALVMLCGMNLKTATAHTKIMNFTSNIMSLIVFVIGNNVLFTAGIVMGLGQVLGAFMGSNLVVVKRVAFVRVCFLAVVGVTILNVLYMTYF